VASEAVYVYFSCCCCVPVDWHYTFMHAAVNQNEAENAEEFFVKASNYSVYYSHMLYTESM